MQGSQKAHLRRPTRRDIVRIVDSNASLGQVFLVTMVARLVTLWGRQVNPAEGD